MSISLPKNKLVTVLLAILIIGSIGAGIYFLAISPKLEELHQKEQELKTQEQILSTLQNKISATKTNTFESTVALQKSVPVKPLSEQLILDIEKAEVVSGSFVVNMDFQEADVEKGEESQEKTEVGEKEQAQTDETVGKSKENTIPLPNGVKKLTANLQIESASYFELEKFLSILENSSRIIVIESIDFSANEEIISTDQKNKPLTYQVTLSAFFMPGLTDLIDQLPKMDAPEPSNKKNPFSDFGDYDSSKIESNYDESLTNLNGEDENQKDENQKDETDSISDSPDDDKKNSPNEEDSTQKEEVKRVKYTVKKGDNLTKIAMEFFKSKDGIQIIKEANDLKDDNISVGQVLIIPLEL
ncbi:LysM peptidoglycan-binding domain-containing protein [Bacillus massilinigeriensis]|uniref:LysM peptidoglycan-binding domain-containing protein n=1 Tax=Bacillus massilionigeriensis TaxID=1805475 RepID=UPI00096B25D6|nr:LysM peptidoglycan-binding domain-containing protein [Bacillus massilionigeriensis]